MARDWSLVVFTLLGQAAVGLFLAAGGTLYFTDVAPKGFAGAGFRLTGVLAVMALLVVALVASLFHLRHPLRAFRAVNNLRASWLSREILSLLAFMFLLAALAYGEWTAGMEARPRKWLFVLAGLAGLSFLWCMARIYTLAAVPFWDRLMTPVTFFLTASVLGTLGSALAFELVGAPESIWRSWATAAAALLAVDFLASIFFFPRYGLLDREAESSLIPPGIDGGALHALRLVLLALGVVLAAAAFLTGALLAALAGEIVGRVLFYGLRGRAERGAGSWT